VVTGWRGRLGRGGAWFLVGLLSRGSPSQHEFELFECVKKGWLLAVHFILGISVEQKFLPSSRMEAHNFRFVSFEDQKFLSLWGITTEDIINTLIEMIFHYPVVIVTFIFCPLQKSRKSLFDTSFQP
jgi:hypothetical protein